MLFVPSWVVRSRNFRERAFEILLMLVFVGLSVSFVEYGRAVAACIGGTGVKVKRNAGIVGILFAVHFAVLVTSLSAGRQSF